MNFINVVSTPYMPPVYCKVREIVDLQEFMPDSENVRAFRISGSSGGSGSVPLYDYPDGKIPKNDTVTDLVLKMRSGKLDRADIDNIKRDLINKAKADTFKAHSDKVLSAIDKVLGLNDSIVSNTDNGAAE